MQFQRRSLLLACLSLGAVNAFAGQTEIVPAGDRVDVRANVAPLSEVLDALAHQTGMKVIYDGPPPHVLVSASIDKVTPIDATLRLLEGLGLTYIVIADKRGQKVETLLVMTAGTASGTATAANAGGSSPQAPAAPPLPPGLSAKFEQHPAETLTKGAPPVEEEEDEAEEADEDEDEKPGQKPVAQPTNPLVPAPIIIPAPGSAAPLFPGAPPVAPAPPNGTTKKP